MPKGGRNLAHFQGFFGSLDLFEIRLAEQVLLANTYTDLEIGLTI